MKYIEQTDNEKVEYEVIINDMEMLQKIINVLDEKCFHKVTKPAFVTGKSIDEVKKKINYTTGIKIIKEVEDQEVYFKGQHMYECELTYKQLSVLSGLLTSLLNNYYTGRDVTNSVNNLRVYENSIEMKTILDKMATDGITQELYSEYELLHEAYIKALSCFSVRPLSKTIYYGSDTEYKELKKR